jgi:hypothetical protein
MIRIRSEARKVIRQYLEDRQDYRKGIDTLERHEPTITLEDLERRLISREDRNQRPSRG